LIRLPSSRHVVPFASGYRSTTETLKPNDRF